MDKPRRDRNNINKEDITNRFSELEKTTLKMPSHFEKIHKDVEIQKCIKEMQEMEDKNERRSNFVFATFIGVLAVFISFSAYKALSLKTPNTNTGTNISIVNSSDKNNTSNNKDNSDTPNNDKGDTTSSNQEGNNKDTSNSFSNSSNEKIYDFVNNKDNRRSTLDTVAMENGGSFLGIGVEYVKAILNKSGFDISKDIVNTKQLVDTLESKGWTKDYDYKNLKKGDVCFTIDLVGQEGTPSHTYIFMGWVEEGKTDYAYIVDSQVSDYSETLHKRNIDFQTTDKDKFHFFMRK